MSAGLEGTPVTWEWGCTLRDHLVVDALEPEVRAAVERYIRARYGLSRSHDGETDNDYVRGWKDGVEAMRDEMSSAYVPPPSRRRSASA